MTLIISKAWVAQQNTFDFKIIVEDCLGIVLLDHGFRYSSSKDSSETMPTYV